MARLRVPSRLLARGLLVLAGAIVVAASAYAVLHLAPGQLGPEPGQDQAVRERIDYWTPEEGEEQFLRPRTERVQQTGDELELVRRLDGPHSPRGDEFALGLGEGWTLADEPAAHASFPPTPFWQQPPETVYVAVPWETGDEREIGGFDDFHRLHEVTRDGMSLVKYHAREPNQFLVDGDTVWFRSAERTALVEPISGTIVDYRDEETLRRASMDRPQILHEIQPPRDNSEKVWEAVVQPTPASQQQLLERAEAERAGHLEHLLALGLPALLAGEVTMAAGILGRPKRWLGR